MGPFQVIEEQEGIEADILPRLARHGRSLGQIPTADHPALLVVSPRAAAHGDGRPERCRMALLPGDTTLPGWDLQAASAVSYGSGPKNTLTLSSREGRKLWLTLQRELVTIQGQVVDRQEFPWILDHGASPQSALAVAGGPARQKRQASGAAPPVSKGSGDRHDEGPVPRNNCRKRAATLVAAVPEWPRRPALPGGRTEGEPGTGRSEGKPGTGRSEGKPGTGRVRGRTWRRRTRCGAARVRRCRRHPSRRRGPGRAGSCRTCSSRRRSAPAATAA